MQIIVKNLEKNFVIKKKREKTVVNAVSNVSFEVEKGEVIAFIGPNGAGKSTTIKMLTGIIKSSSGEIKVSGLDPQKDRKQLAYRIGCMFGQKSQLYMHLSVRDTYMLLCSMYDVRGQDAKNRIDEVAKLFEIEGLLDMVVKKLSLGQRMICEIAGNFLHNPEIIFLDEPTIGLDFEVKARIRRIIKKLNQEKQTTIFLTSHDLGDVEALCNRIIIINKGTIVMDSSMEEIKSKYLTHKKINITYSDIIENTKFEYEVREVDGCKVNLVADTSKINMGELLMYFSSLGNIIDIQIDAIPLEDVISKIYKERG